MSDSPPPIRPATPTTPTPSAGPAADPADPASVASAVTNTNAAAAAAAATVIDSTAVIVTDTAAATAAAATSAVTDTNAAAAAAATVIDSTAVIVTDTAAATAAAATVIESATAAAAAAAAAADTVIDSTAVAAVINSAAAAAAAAAAVTGPAADSPPIISTTTFATTPGIGLPMQPMFMSPEGSAFHAGGPAGPAFGTPMGPHGTFTTPMMGPTPFQASMSQPFYSSPGAPPGASNPFAAVAQLQQAMMDQASSHQQYVQFQQETVQQQQMQQQAAFQEQLQQFQAQFQQQFTAQQQRHHDDIEALRADRRRSGPAPSAVDEASANRRSTFFSGHEYDAGDVEKQLKYFTCEAKFHGRDGECIDAFLTTLERALGLKDKQLWVLFLDRQLSGPAASAFQQQYPTLDSVSYTDAAAFLRLRHRPMRHLLETLTSIIRAKQSSSVTALFAYLEAQTRRLSHAGCTPDDIVSDPLLVAVVMSALKPSIASRLMQDASKLRADYSLAQLKEDALSIESALKDAPANPQPNSRQPSRAAHMAGVDPAYEVYVTDLDSQPNSQNRSEAGPRPAYEHADWYRRDGNSCRYCKTVGHNTSCCDTLYRKRNRGAKGMPEATKAANQAIVDHQ